jgi:hypothetical protein
MKLRTNLAAIAAACAALALPSAASAENATVLGFQVTSVSGGTATGILHCTTTTLAGQQASFPIGPYADASVLVPGAMVGIRVERSTIVGTSATPPCDSQLGTQPASDDGRQAQDLPEGTDDSPTGDAPTADAPADPGAVKPAGRHGRGNDGGANDGPGGGHKLPNFLRGFQNRVWKFGGSANGFDNGQLSMTLEKVFNLPRRFRSQDDDMIDQDSIVLVSDKTRIRTSDGHKATTADLDNADDVRVEGKLVPPKKWVTDEDGTPVTTIRARRVIIVSSATQG